MLGAPNISIKPSDVNNFVDRAARCTTRRTVYARISRDDVVDLTNVRFLVYCLMRQLANFKDQNVNFRQQARYLRSDYHRRTISRHVAGLAQSGRIERIGRGDWGMVRNKRGRPIRMEFIRLVTDPQTALLARFIMLLAFWRDPWDTLTKRRIQGVLHCRNEVAGVLASWLRSRRGSLAKRTIRAIVFFSEWRTHAEWRQYPNYRHKPDPNYARSPIVMAAPPLLKNKSYLSKVYAGLAPGDLRKPQKGPPRSIATAIARFINAAPSSQHRRERIPGTENLESVRSCILQDPQRYPTPEPKKFLQYGYISDSHPPPRSKSDPPSHDRAIEELKAALINKIGALSISTLKT